MAKKDFQGVETEKQEEECWENADDVDTALATI